jgi:transposase
MVLNADINGALNILKKAFPFSVALNPLMGRGSGLGNPCRVKPY